MTSTNKFGAPKQLEKMLFINHKEDLMLNDKLHDLKLRSRYKAIELDRERIKVKNEWRNSRKKNITLSEAIKAGLLPQPPMATGTDNRNGPLKRETSNIDSRHNTRLSNNRPVVSAPVQRKQGSVDQPVFSRSTSFVENRPIRRVTTDRRSSLHPVIQEVDENVDISKNAIPRRHSADTVGEYVLGEFEKMSQVVPDILRALAKKKEKQQEIDDRISHVSTVPNPKDINLIEYEPDMNKVRKTVMSVKTLRHRMAISKRLNSVKPQKSLEQMIKDKIENAGENDEYTDGTCALMKRRLEKKRRSSESESSDGQNLPRRHSMFASIPDSAGTKSNSVTKPLTINKDKLRQRSASVVQFPSVLSRQSSSVGFGSLTKLGTLGVDPCTSAGGAKIIDEDVLKNRQRVLHELNKYQLIQDRVDRFLIKTASRNKFTVLEEILQIK